jgi:hypothetical protein
MILTPTPRLSKISKTDDERWAPGAFVAPRLHRIHLRFRLALLLTARPELRSLRRRTGTWGDELKLPPAEGGARGASGTSENPVARDQAAAQAQQWGQQQGQSPRRLAIRTPEEPSSGPREPSHCRVHCREPITVENVSWARITFLGPTIIARAGRPSRSTRGTSSSPSPPPPRRRPTGPRPRTPGPAGRCACAPRAGRARQHVAGKPWRFRPCSLKTLSAPPNAPV